MKHFNLDLNMYFAIICFCCITSVALSRTSSQFLSPSHMAPSVSKENPTILCHASCPKIIRKIIGPQRQPRGQTIEVIGQLIGATLNRSHRTHDVVPMGTAKRWWPASGGRYGPKPWVVGTKRSLGRWCELIVEKGRSQGLARGAG